MFPFTIEISKKMDGTLRNKGLILEAIKEILIKNRENIKEMDEGFVKFSTKVSMWNWELFSLVDGGTFMIKENKITFRFSTYRLFVICTTMSFIVYLVTREQNSWIGLIAFMTLCFGNWIKAISRGYKALDTIIYEVIRKLESRNKIA